jgi:hypothetical protein
MAVLETLLHGMSSPLISDTIQRQRIRLKSDRATPFKPIASHVHKQTTRRPALVRPVFRTLLLPRLQFAERKINTFITAGGPKAYDVKDMPTQSLVPVQVRV